MKLILAVAVAVTLAGCVGAQVSDKAVPASAAAPAQSLQQVTHKDLLAANARALGAAAAAQKAGNSSLASSLTARANMWLAIDGLLSAQEMQAEACLAAIKSALPSPGPSAQFAGVFDAIEAGAEAVGNFSGIPASVKLACEPLPIPALPKLPGVPALP